MPDVTMEACMKAVCDTKDACILDWLDPWSRFHELTRRDTTFPHWF